MRTALLTLSLLVIASSAQGFQHWNDIRHSALLPDETVVVRAENPASAGELNSILYAEAGIQETTMTPIIDGPSTVAASVPGAVNQTRYYGFRLVAGPELELMPVRIADGVPPGPEDLSRLAADAAGDELFGYSHLDLVDCHLSFDGDELFAAIRNNGGGFPVSQGLTFFGYLLGIADPALADPDTVFALMYTFEQAGIISPGLYKITGTGLGDLERLGDVTIQEFPATNTLLLSCQLADLYADADFMAWFDPTDPTLGVAAFTQRITLLGGAQEADRTPGGRCYLRDLTITPITNQLPELSQPAFQGSGAQATAEIDYLDPDGHCPVISEIIFDGVETYPLYPQSLDYGSVVTYRSDAGLPPLASGSWSLAVFRFSDDQSTVIEHEVPAVGIIDAGVSGIEQFSITRVVPNPFNPTTTIEYSLPHAQTVSLAVFSVEGHQVRQLIHRPVAAGTHRVVWDGTNDRGHRLASGIFFCRLQIPEGSHVRKIILAK